ncbi:hypothetical protein EHS13_17225 [Paenibacillus psychroresistens]|uniref:Uncharacterized protein n=1 Tax=Paenibacillus psychroresistens TaxID=1778678 RepID=A0A6B8RLI9_9BACL|nr:hypothetical protein [Paenibacillus psychroresistens]QGQ96502.1 hypothetical protein EHS13_17225 [Paenibacillus psychroresistens]
MKEFHANKEAWPSETQQMTWTAINQLEVSLFDYFKSVVIFYRSIEQRKTLFFLVNEVLPLSNALKSIIKIQNNLLKMTAFYLVNMEHTKLIDDYVIYYHSYMKLNRRIDELWEMTNQYPNLQNEIKPQFQQFKYYFEKKRSLMRKFGNWV